MTIESNWMKQDQSSLKKNPLWRLECTGLYKCYRSLASNIGMFKTKQIKQKTKLGKMSFGTNIHSLQSSVFATRKKKGVAEARNWFYCLFSLKLSQKQNEHASRYFFLSKFYISSKTYVLEDQTLYIFFIFFLKMDILMWQKSQRKNNNLYLTNCNGSVTVLLHNARTRALFGFWYLRKKATCLPAEKQMRQLWCVLLYLLKLCFLSTKNSNKFSSIKKPLFSSLCTNGESVSSLDFLFVLKRENYY